MFNNLDSLFKKNPDENILEKVNPTPTITKNTILKNTRSDKGKNVKFPVTYEQQIQFKQSFQKFRRVYEKEIKTYYPKIGQCKYNTLLIVYALDHLEIVEWNLEYSDKNKYFRTSIPHSRHSNEIAGPYGLSVRKNMSERKAVYMLAIAGLKTIEQGGKYHEIFQLLQSYSRKTEWK
jgi:hypothetical protein